MPNTNSPSTTLRRSIIPPIRMCCACGSKRLKKCPDARWIFSVDIPDMQFRDKDGFPKRLRSLSNGIVYTREEAVAAVEEAIIRIVSGPTAVS